MAGTECYIAIDLKSFYASVEAADRGLDTLTTRLVVADESRTKQTICLAVSPALKALGVKNRCRLYQVPEALDALVAVPRMKRYMEVSAEIYKIYLRYIAPEDIHVYSIDEVFIHATPYLNYYHTTPAQFARFLVKQVFIETRIHATAGMGTNLFLAKVALDILAKKAPNGMGFLDEEAFQKEMWFHEPLNDFWSIGRGLMRRLRKHGIHNMAGICAADPRVLYREFGRNAEYLIDHAWGQEPCTMEDLRRYQPQAHGHSQGQTLARPYAPDDARNVLMEMVWAELVGLAEKNQRARAISLALVYADDAPPHSVRASRTLPSPSNALFELKPRFAALFDELCDVTRMVRGISISFDNLVVEKPSRPRSFCEPSPHAAPSRASSASSAASSFLSPSDTLSDASSPTTSGAPSQQESLMKAAGAIRRKYGKNALLPGTSYRKTATARERNQQVGGHHA